MGDGGGDGDDDCGINRSSGDEGGDGDGDTEIERF
jgi:hypothetical protein